MTSPRSSEANTEQLSAHCAPNVASMKAFAEQQWCKATEMLQSNPNLMTGGIFSLALKHRPPVHIVQFMLQLNPKAASIPDTGPTPLQIAVKYGCNAAVIRTIIEACPFALVRVASNLSCLYLFNGLTLTPCTGGDQFKLLLASTSVR